MMKGLNGFNCHPFNDILIVSLDKSHYISLYYRLNIRHCSTETNNHKVKTLARLWTHKNKHPIQSFMDVFRELFGETRQRDMESILYLLRGNTYNPFHIEFMSSWLKIFYSDGLVQDCSNSIALAMELLQSWTKPSIYPNVDEPGSRGNYIHWFLGICKRR